MTERKSLLEQLKVLGRNPANSESIFAKKVVLFVSIGNTLLILAGN
jgi:hypothetical protein